MNHRGVFLTFMVFLLIGAVLALNLVLTQSGVREERTLIEESAFKEVNETFNSIYSQIYEERAGYAGEVQKRIIPRGGSYVASGTSFEVTQQIPPESVGVSQSDTIDGLNLFSIFMSNPKINQGTGVESQITTAFNIEAWGGSGGENPELGYLIQPFCLRYLPLQAGDRFMGYQIPGEDWEEWESEKADGLCTLDNDEREHCYYWGCEKPFDLEHVKSITIDFTVGKPDTECTEYLTASPLICAGSNSFKAGGTTCKDETGCSDPENPDGDNPCVTINFHEEECQGACIIDGETVSANSDIDNTGNVVNLSFTDGDVILFLLSKNDPMSLGKMFLMYYGGAGTCINNTIKVNITFTGPVGAVQYAGFEFAVKKPGFDYCRRTKGATCTAGCGDGTCAAGELCPRDAVLCPAPALCYEKTCLNGCNALGAITAPIYAGQEDAGRCDGSITTGFCTTLPCGCNGNGQCCSKKCDNVCANSLCFGTDPDCDSAGGITGICCGDGACDLGEVCIGAPGTECNPEPKCSDNTDNDGDGKKDCADHPDCDGKELCQATESSPVNRCGDGFDNDGDGTKDCADLECNGKAGPGGGTCQFGSEITPVDRCNDLFDNDGDGTKDCADPECYPSPYCGYGGYDYGGYWVEYEICDDWTDNDGDGAIDCEDPDCGADPLCTYSYGYEYEICDNSIDDDGDGWTDCDDPDCSSDPDCGYGGYDYGGYYP